MPTLKERPAKALLFTQHHGFRKALTARVSAYISENKVHTRDLPAMYLKSAIILTCWLGIYFLLLFGGFSLWVNGLLCIALGFSMAAIGLNIGHDANHGSYSDNPRINRLASLAMELIGLSSFVWRQRHNVHHTYPNIGGLDEDLETGGLIRLSPHEEWRPHFRLQVWYVPLLYAFVAFDFLRRDALVFFTGRTSRYHRYPKMKISERVIFVCGKLFFFTYILVLPMLLFPWWQVLIAFTTIMFTLGLINSAISVPVHLVQAADFPEPVGEPLHIENEWAIHQVQTTVNYAPNNPLVNAYVGGTNYQIEHHLFPQICHLHYPRLSPIVRKTCEEFGITYSVSPTMGGALLGHARALREFGRKPELKAV
ncbi:MAG TPA: acyl-CoA desaturase [Acidisarcina sp.]